MGLINSFVSSPVKVSVGVLLLALFGYVALLRMPLQLTPEVQTPTITVETRWPGASPQEVEREIVLEQEEYLKSVEGITKLTSESSDSSGKVTMEFIVGTNMDEVLLKVNSQLQQVPSYPEDADQPVISTANANDRPIAWFILSARSPSDEQFAEFRKKHPQFAALITPVEQSHNVGLAMLRLRNLAAEHPEFKELLPPPDFDVTTLRRFAEDEIEAAFERVPGVSQANVIGGLEDELQVVVDPEKLAARQLTVVDVRNALRGQNQDTSGGDFWEGKRRYVVRTLGQFRSPAQVEMQLLAVRGGAPVYVRDVATVRSGYKKPTGLVRRFGESSIAINALRETGTNVIDVMHGLQDARQRLDEGILKRRGLQLMQVYDETEYIYSSIDLVQDNIYVGGALTMIVLMSFLHLGLRTLIAAPLILATAVAAAFGSAWFFAATLIIVVGTGFWFARGSLVVGLAIPISIVGTFLILGMLGRTLNVISLAGLAFAVGMLVDNAVVVLENIYRRNVELREPPFTAAVRGTSEVMGAIVASTLTTVAVFLPVVFVEEEAGQLFRDIALAITAAVTLSGIVAVTVIPTAAARLLDTHDKPDLPADRARRRGANALVRPIERGGSLFVAAIAGLNDWIQRGVVRRVAVIAVLLTAAVGLSWVFWPKVEYLPTGNRNLVFGILLPPPGYNLDQLMAMGETVEAGLRPYWDIDPDSPEAAKLDYPVIGDFFFVARGRQVFMGIRAHDGQQVANLIPLVRAVGMSLPGTFAVAKQSSLFENGLTAGRTIEVEISGRDLPTLVGLGGKVLGQAMGLFPPGTQIRPVPSLDLSSPELHVEPRLIQAAELGLNSTDIGYTVDALVDGAYAGDYYLGGDKIDLTIQGESRYTARTQDIAALPIATPIGQLVPLGAVADVVLSSGPEQINHRETQRAITIEISPPPDMPLEDAMTLVRSKVVEPLSGQMPDGYRINLAGTADKLRSTWTALQFNVLLALLITYLLMAALFESWLYPLVIILSVPLGAVGGILGLNLLNIYLVFNGQQPQLLDVLTMLGFVILIGTVVNNPILIVHQALNLIREEGQNVRQAIGESVRTRIRPIFMTTTTTVLGLMPLVLFPGSGSELYRGLGAVVLGGLVVSTVVTLVLVPALFTLTLEAKQGLIGGARRLLGQRGDDAPRPEPAQPVGARS